MWFRQPCRDGKGVRLLWVDDHPMGTVNCRYDCVTGETRLVVGLNRSVDGVTAHTDRSKVLFWVSPVVQYTTRLNTFGTPLHVGSLTPDPLSHLKIGSGAHHRAGIFPLHASIRLSAPQDPRPSPPHPPRPVRAQTTPGSCPCHTQHPPSGLHRSASRPPAQSAPPSTGNWSGCPA